MRDRFCPVLEPDFRCCRPPFSFYRFIEKYWRSNEENRTLHRVFSLMRKMNAQTIVIEDLARKGELDLEATAVETRCYGPVQFRANRFSFFSTAVTRDTLPYVDDGDFLGYAVLVCLRLPDESFCRYIYESVIVEPSFQKHGDTLARTSLPSHYIHCVRRYSAWVAGHRFTLSGSFFSQQNGLTHVCAHAALRWLLNNLPERAQEIISYEDINADLKIDHASHRVGQYGKDPQAVGLPMDDLLSVIKRHGYKCLDAEFETPRGRPQPYWRFVYSIVESGYPALVFFRTERARHVICVIGHTLNSDIWDEEARLAYSGAPRAGYLSTASWVDHFVIHDDNYGMYFCMPSKALLPATREGGPFQVTGALGIVPAEIELRPLEAEFLASLALRLVLAGIDLKSCYWLEALKQEQAAFGKWVVLRTLLTSKAIYHQHLRDLEDVGGDVLKEDEVAAIVDRRVPDHFWITEITLTDIYTANKRKVGELLFKLSAPEEEGDSLEAFTRNLFARCIAIRLPGNIVVPKVGPKQVSLAVRTTGLTGHVPLLRTCRPASLLEW